MSDREFLFLLGAARAGGNTEMLARRAAKELPAAVRQRWIRLPEKPLPPFDDRRHAEGGHPDPEGNERLLMDATFAASDLVLASPVYWYSVSAATKLYLDYWSGWIRVAGAEFKPRMRGKTLWGVTVLNETEREAEPLVGMLRLCAHYLGMHWGGVLVGTGSRPGDVLVDDTAMTAARTFFTAASPEQVAAAHP
ncbi:flavodoxin family protein [Amycolatopsis jiangsuensis]|uniref:Multimeric flavodoxin WrbA n=1 Tax=Amycolatopsis jiangsuensis TaxID=1181879 RepID=A0A840IRH8_9PSEU|nr:NAD(P)H-dependent oxidoreductase [Amycolatopsis jiangsuensis]MBB4684500.1 multimeric flavodoxin WrbA [Amycolatopsis jiangsuensis]